MGKIVANFFISLDGVVESPNEFIFPYVNDEVGAAVSAGTEAATAFLLGRRLFEEWASYWPDSTDEPFAGFINGVDKFVLSNTLSTAEAEGAWRGTTVLPDPADGRDVAEQVRDLKDRSSGDIVMSGSPETVGWLAQNGLLDELHLLMAPIAVGAGRRLLDGARLPLKLVENTALQTGVLHLVYRPDSPA